MSMLREVADLLDEREAEYGCRSNTWRLIGYLVGVLSAEDDTREQTALLTLLCMKLVRRTHTPNNPDHYRDALGYLDMLWDARRRDVEHGEVAEAFIAAMDEDPDPEEEESVPVIRQLRQAIRGE